MFNLRKYKGPILVLIAAISWGFSGTCGQFLAQNNNFDPAVTSFFRMAVGGLLLLVYELIFRRAQFLALLKDKNLYLDIVMFAFFGIVCCQITYLKGIAYTNAAIGTMMEQFCLVIVLAVTCFRMHRKPHFLEILALILALIAAISITTHFDFGTFHLTKEALLWGAASAIACAAYILLPVKLLKHYSGIEVTTVSMLVAAIISIPVLHPWTYSVTFNQDTILGLLGMILLGTVAAYLAFMQGVKSSGPVVAGIINSSELVWAALISAIWLGTTFGAFDIIALCLTFIMAILISIDSARSQ